MGMNLTAQQDDLAKQDPAPGSCQSEGRATTEAPNPFFTRRTQCPICAGVELSSLYKCSYDDARMQECVRLGFGGHMETKYLAGLDYEVLECRTCGLLFQRHVPNEAGTRRLFEVWVDPTYVERPGGEGPLNRKLARAIFSFSTRYMGRRRLRMLDYGAGFGGLCCLARDFGLDASPLEIVAPYFQVLRQRGFEPLRPGQESENHYDLVVCTQVIEHAPDPLGIVRALHRALKDDGLLLLEVHNGRGIKGRLGTVDSLPIERYRAALEPCAPVEHMNCFTNRTLKRLCRQVGFTPVFRPLLWLRHGVSWGDPRQIPKDLLRPFYRHFLGTSLFLRK
jgi:SAM-dependent methyltransferase